MTLLERITFWTIMGILGCCGIIIAFFAGFFGMALITHT